MSEKWILPSFTSLGTDTAEEVVCVFSFETSLDLRQQRILLTYSSGCQSAPIEHLAYVYNYTNGYLRCCLVSLNVHAQCPQIRGLGQANFIIKNNPSAANLLLNNNFEKIPPTDEHFFIWLISFSVSQTLLFPGTLGRLSLRREEFFIHSMILGHSSPWKPARPKRLLCKA